MLYWWLHFENEFPINCCSTQWKWTYVLDFGPWRWSALSVSYMNKRPSRMQGQFQFSKSGGAGNIFRSGYEIYLFILWGLPRGVGLWTSVPIHLSLEVRMSALIQPQVYVFQIPYPITTYKGKFYVNIRAEYYSTYSKFHEIPIVCNLVSF